MCLKSSQRDKKKDLTCAIAIGIKNNLTCAIAGIDQLGQVAVKEGIDSDEAPAGQEDGQQEQAEHVGAVPLLGGAAVGRVVAALVRLVIRAGAAAAHPLAYTLSGSGVFLVVANLLKYKFSGFSS